MANALNAEHTYAAAGTYTVTATLTFGAGQTAQCQDTVTIEIGKNTPPADTKGHVLGTATSRTTAKTLPNTGTVNVLSTVALFATLAVTIITVSQLVKMQLSRRSD